MSGPFRWTWMNGAAYLTRENAHNDYIASVFRDDVTPDLAKWRTYVGRERALPSMDLDGAVFHIRTVLNRDDIPQIPPEPPK